MLVTANSGGGEPLCRPWSEFEDGKRVEFNNMHCSVWFARDAKGWRVVQRDCEGE